jgi:hypothetical protein
MMDRYARCTSRERDTMPPRQNAPDEAAALIKP